MAVAHTYWLWESALSGEMCDKILADANELAFAEGAVGGDNKINKSIRDNMITWLPRMHLAECILFAYGMEANLGSNWRLEASHVYDKVQISRYESGQFYDIHHDVLVYDHSPDFERKLSAVILLSDPDTYKGGDLEVCRDVVRTRARGSIIVFPSYNFHQVTPVTEGVRHSAILWIAGARLK